MKNKWLCPHCTQTSTRHWNLKTHIKRKHGGMGQPMRGYSHGNTVVDSTSSPTIQTFHDSFTPVSTVSKDRYYFDPWGMKNASLEDRIFEFICRYHEERIRGYPKNQPFLPTADTYLPLPIQLRQNNFTHKRIYPEPYNRLERSNIEHTSYEDVTGFKGDVCPNCLVINIFRTYSSSQEFALHNVHKCDPIVLNSVNMLDPIQRSSELWREINYALPQVLLSECKDWARNTSGQLYLMAKPSNEQIGNEIEIQENYDSLPFLQSVLSKSKIKLNDPELLEFLKLARNQTKACFTIKANSARGNLRYIVAVTPRLI
ncbi:MAG TPA: hypothetical protein VJ599_02455 [Nitrososphaeraceae archaeon]|nr:hypothetical protein [Nitrososphaeraceae archaeon]